jgi:hypothetical protein
MSGLDGARVVCDESAPKWYATELEDKEYCCDSILCCCFHPMFCAPAASHAAACADGVQASGSIYRICMPAGEYNGVLVVWAHGFQDAGTPVKIPEDQLCLGELCIPSHR